MRLRRFTRLAPAYLQAATKQDWALALLALGSLAPGVAALAAWLQVVWTVRHRVYTASELGWVFPPALLEAITPAGVLLGAGVATLLIGCLGLSNAYLASVERRMGDLALLLSLGLSRLEVASLLLVEALGLAVLGTGAGALLGLALGWASWPSARAYFQLEASYQPQLWPLLLAVLAGILATLLFVGVTGVATLLRSPLAVLRGRQLRHWMREWGHWRLSTLGTLFTGLMMAVLGLLTLSPGSALALTMLALGLALLLNAGSLLLTRSYWRLPTPAARPLWALAVQGLARHRRQTAGMTLAMTAGAVGVGLAALPALDPATHAMFPIWMVMVLLVACASLVLTTAALAALERRQELGLLMALGARRSRVRQLILLEYGIVAAGGGTLGALFALATWALTGMGHWPQAVLVALADLIAALLTAWLGAAPVLWLISRRPPGVALRDKPWLGRR